jgi:3,4-dihydroxy 2-butanone 4-phosphate synthase/GTP cyclohydrolase II
MSVKFNTIPEAIAAIKNGEVIIVVDDENRENEGDFVAAAESITPDVVNFMATHGRGLICTPLTESRCTQLQLNRMVQHNTDPMETAFTVSVDLKGKGVTTGISAQDRCKTIHALTAGDTRPNDLSRPGHVFPLIAKEGGVLRRTGHTEAAIDFARLAGKKPAGVVVEIMNEDGSMARLPDLIKVAEKFQLKLVSIEDLVAYRMQHDSLIEKKNDFNINTIYGDFRMITFQQTTNQQVHIALVKGDWKEDEPVLVRINSTRHNNDLLGVLTGSNSNHLEKVCQRINEEGKGALLFINQRQQAEDLLARIEELKQLQEKGNFNSSPPLRMDIRDFGIGAQILHELNISKIKVMSNSKQLPRVGLTGYGLEIYSHERY